MVSVKCFLSRATPLVPERIAYNRATLDDPDTLPNKMIGIIIYIEVLPLKYLQVDIRAARKDDSLLKLSADLRIHNNHGEIINELTESTYSLTVEDELNIQ